MWRSWISYTVELNFPFELLTIPNVLESVISLAEEILLRRFSVWERG